MSKYVFVLGAGASVHAGVPTMAGFLDRARDSYESDTGVQWREDFDRIFKILAELQSVHSKAELDLSNIEVVFSTFELGRTPRRSWRKRRRWSWSVTLFRRVISFFGTSLPSARLAKNSFVASQFSMLISLGR